MTKAISLSPRVGDYYVLRAQIRMSNEQTRDARKDLEKALALGADRAQVMELLRNCAEKQNK